MVNDLSNLPILFAADQEDFDYYNGKYQSFIQVTENLIDVSNAPKCREVEIAVIKEIDPYSFEEPCRPPEITKFDIADTVEDISDDLGIDYMDYYKELASNGWLQEFIKQHIANHVQGHASASDENISIKTRFLDMLEIVRNLQAEIEDAGGPEKTMSLDLCDPQAEEREEEHKNERLAYDLLVEDYQKIINKPYFKPDEWIANENELSPIMVTREQKQIPRRIRYRIYEIYSSFIFGHWMSVIALSRCLLEYAIIDSAPSHQIQIYLIESEIKKKNLSKNKKWTKDLKDLVKEIATKYPKLESNMEHIRKSGNKLMHPPAKKTEKQAFDELIDWKTPGKADAKDCIDGIVKIIHTLYSKPNNS